MKAVLGMLFVLVGATTGWLVLSGKLPKPAASNSAPTFTPGATGVPDPGPSGQNIPAVPGGNSVASTPFVPSNSGIRL